MTEWIVNSNRADEMDQTRSQRNAIRMGWQMNGTVAVASRMLQEIFNLRYIVQLRTVSDAVSHSRARYRFRMELQLGLIQ